MASSMRVLLTGATGRLGSVVYRQLLEAGHTVVAVDLRPSEDTTLPPIKVVDLTRFADVWPLVENIDVVCHLGSKPAFKHEPMASADGYANNVTGCYNLFLAALHHGVGRIVYASSLQAYGAFSMGQYDQERGIRDFVKPRYLPIDEDHPLLACGPYASSKAAGEQMLLNMIAMRPSLCGVSLRYSTIVTDRRRPPTPEQIARWKMISETMPKWRRFIGAYNTFIDIDDAARATVMACGYGQPGTHSAFNVVHPAARHAWSRDLLAQAYDGLPEMRAEVGPNDSLLSTERARTVLGFVPQHGPGGLKSF